MPLCFPTLGRSQQWLKSLLALSIGLFGLLVSSGNILDYDSNWQFVRHVLSMDSMQPWFHGQALLARAITNPAIQQAGYILIIVGELLCGVLCALGGIQMLVGTCIGNHGCVYQRGKTVFTLGCIPALLVWYTGFAVVGSEYFAMWASQWNGQMTAYTFALFILASQIYISQPEAKIEGADSP